MTIISLLCYNYELVENRVDNECACLCESEFAKGLLQADKGS